ncbi:MAG: hypothetical protein SGI99_11930 [Pseudomonadota bacterium]|nr:hypothetical protein [Pseudomonadota bacterium]
MLRELEIFQQLGLSPRQALASATTNYSNAYHWDDLGLTPWVPAPIWWCWISIRVNPSLRCVAQNACSSKAGK